MNKELRIKNLVLNNETGAWVGHFGNVSVLREEGR